MDSRNDLSGVRDADELLDQITAMAAAILEIEAAGIEEDDAFGSLGFDSASLKLFASRLSERFGVCVDAVLLFTYPTLRGLCDHLAGQGLSVSPPSASPPEAPSVSPAVASPPAQPGRDIAIVGFACRLPGAQTREAFWANQDAQRNCISEVPKRRWDAEALLGDPHRDSGRTDVRWGGFIEGEDLFAPEFFGISAYEAELMDPQHRLFIKACWEAIWDAGYDPAVYAGRSIGVFAGVQFQDYQKLVSDRGSLSAQLCTGNAHAMLANRVSFLLDLHGPSEAVDTACSGSLVAIHNAVRALRQGECEMALAGGVNLLLNPDLFIMGRQLGVLSPTGQCRTFDADADGYVRAEGVGALLLKPLEDALRDRDHIHGVIKGTAVNHGGKAASLTAPNSRAQADLMVRALNDAGLTPNDVSYVEMHGTGTELGDPIEVESVKAAFRTLRERAGLRPSPCALGSVKANIGHLEPAAGIAGVINVLMAMRHARLPGLSNFRGLNPHIALDDGLYVQTESGEWPAAHEQAARVAMVNSFGFGGTNASVVLRQHAEPRHGAGVGGRVELPIVGSDPELLRAHADALMNAIEAPEDEKNGADLLRNIAFTLQGRNENRSARVVIAASSLAELKRGLRAVAAGNAEGEDLAIFHAERSDHPDLSPSARRWLQGGIADWPDLPGARRCPLPVSPWPDRSCWFEPRAAELPTAKAPATTILLEPFWQAKPLAAKRNLAGKCIWVIGRDERQVEEFCAELHLAVPAKTTVITSVQGSEGAPEPSLEIWNLAGDEPDIVALLPGTAEGDGGQETRILFDLAKELIDRSFSKQVDVFYVVARDYGVVPAIDALSALAKSAFLEHDPLRMHSLFFGDRHSRDWRRLLAAELSSEAPSTPRTIRHAGARSTLELREAAEGKAAVEPAGWFRDGGVYLVPGGAGELGFRLLKRLLEEVDATLVLSGRSPLQGEVKERIDALAGRGQRADRIRYIQCDIVDLDQTRRMIDAVVERHGRLDGILNLVTAHDDAYLYNKSWADFFRVSASKVQGTLNLDLASAGIELGFFAAFSSLAALGLAGGADYAYGCAFQNAFARWRDDQVAQGRRHGVSRAISWSRWKWDKYVTASFDDWFASMGFAFLDVDAGLGAWREAMRRAAPETFVVHGWPEEMFGSLDLAAGLLRSSAGGPAEVREVDPVQPGSSGTISKEAPGIAAASAPTPVASPTPTTNTAATTNEAAARERLERDLSAVIGELLKLDAVDPATPFSAIGLDSVMAIRLIILIEQRLSVRLTPKVLLKHASVAGLANHMLSLQAVAAEAAGPEEPDQDAIANHLAARLKDILRADEIALDARFASVGVDSIIAVKLASEFDRQYGVGISPRWFIDFPTVNRMALEIGNRRSARA